MGSIAEHVVAGVRSTPAAAGLEGWAQQVRSALSLYATRVFAVQNLIAWASHHSEHDAGRGPVEELADTGGCLGCEQHGELDQPSPRGSDRC